MAKIHWKATTSAETPAPTTVPDTLMRHSSRPCRKLLVLPTMLMPTHFLHYFAVFRRTLNKRFILLFR
jgi:hypothetical protein